MSYAVVKGERLRVTKTNSCGRPLPGAANRLVTEGFIEVGLTPEMKAAEELETTNAAGKVCVKDRTAPERKRWNIALNLCDVDPDLWALIASWTRILDFRGDPIGVRDRKSVDGNSGVMFEVWTGGESEDDCPLPTDDSIFSQTGSGRNYGYLSFLGTEFTADGLTVNAQPSTFAFTGITKAPTQWGRGPYNVSARDANGTPGRLLVPFHDEEDDNHLVLFRTPVEPPAVTDGAKPLDIATKFVAPNYYYGGPANAPAADVAPAQDTADEFQNLSLTGVPTGGTFSLLARYPGEPDRETAAIVVGATPANVLTALGNLDDGFAAADWAVTGGTLPAGVIKIVPPEGVTVAASDNNLTGGTAPTVVVTPR